MYEQSELGDRLRILAKSNVGNVTWGELLKNHSYWRIGGPADLMVEPCSIEQVQIAMKTIHGLALPHVVIGAGSNLLFDDAGVRGVVLKIGRGLSQVRIEDTCIEVEAGAYVPKLARRACSAGLTGLEHIVGIPGTIGGLLVMNGGSLRKSIGSNVHKVWLVNTLGQIEEKYQDECNFSYRHSAFQESGKVIVRALLKCSSGEIRSIRHEMLDILRTRRNKFPVKLPSCGSVFLSSEDLHKKWGPPGKLIEESGLKGYRIGDAQVSEKHANFIVNIGKASSGDIIDLIKYIILTVHDRTGAKLSCEADYVNCFGNTCKISSLCSSSNSRPSYNLLKQGGLQIC